MSNESDHQKAFVDILKSYNVFPGCINEERGRTGSSIPDVRVVRYGGTAVAIFEFKNSVSSELYFQGIAGFIHSQTALQCQRSPMLLITCIGCTCLQVYGVVWNRGDLCVDPLSSVSLLHVPTYPFRRINGVARVFAAVTAFAKDIPTTSKKGFGPYF